MNGLMMDAIGNQFGKVGGGGQRTIRRARN